MDSSYFRLFDFDVEIDGLIRSDENRLFVGRVDVVEKRVRPILILG